MKTPTSPDSQTDKLAQLLAKVGRRTTPPIAMESEVRAAVYAEWLHLTQARKVRQRHRWLSAAAVLLAAVGIGWLALDMRTNDIATTAPLLATITKIQGNSTLNNTTAHNDSEVHDGDALRTGRDGSLRMELNTGISVRLASDTRLRWLNGSEVQLEQGAVYVDSHAQRAALTIHTTHGDVTHLGTRYLVSADRQSLRVAVREGKVAIHARNAELTVNALQQVHLDANGQAQRSDLAMNDASWQWADTLAQPFVLENRSVAEFLQWVSNETGYELSYASNDIQNSATRTMLHGQQTSMPPLQTLPIVLATTDFRAYIQGQRLLITQAR